MKLFLIQSELKVCTRRLLYLIYKLPIFNGTLTACFGGKWNAGRIIYHNTNPIVASNLERLIFTPLYPLTVAMDCARYSIDRAGLFRCSITWQFGHTGRKSLTGSTKYAPPMDAISTR